MPAPAVASNFGVPSLRIRALIWVGVPVMLILGLVRSPFAQSGPGGYGPGPGPGMERMRGGDRLGPPGGENRMHLLEAIEGPLTPAVIQDSVGTVERQSKMLLDQDKEFEKGLKDLLSKDQQKRYQKLKQNREKEARERWQRDQPTPEARDGWTYRANGR